MDDRRDQDPQAGTEPSGAAPRATDAPGGDAGIGREPLEDFEGSAAAGAISGRAMSRAPQDLAPGDTMGGTDRLDTDLDEPDANAAQAEPLSGNPPA